jgi:glycosyltransferase involved in cell wall biosynthesis
MKSKRVLHLVQSLNFGGVESRMRTIAFNSSLSDCEHLFCAIAGGGAVAEDIYESGAPIKILNIKSKIPSLRAILGIFRHIKFEHPDIVHCHGAEANFHGLIASRLGGVSVVFAEEIGLPNHSKKAKFIFRLVYNLADALIAVSNPVKQKVVEMGEIKKDKCKVLLSPFNMLQERDNYVPHDVFHVGYIGRLEEIKNPLGLLYAIALLRDRGMNVHLKIAGDGSQRIMLEREAVNLGISKQIDFLGFVPHPFTVMDDINLYVLPSFSEGLSNSLIEAMSAGIPSLATAVGGTPEVIKHNKSGWLLPSAEPQAIADGIEKCITIGSEKINIIGKQGRQSVIENFSPKKYFKTCDKFYNSFFKND